MHKSNSFLILSSFFLTLTLKKSFVSSLSFLFFLSYLYKLIRFFLECIFLNVRGCENLKSSFKLISLKKFYRAIIDIVRQIMDYKTLKKGVLFNSFPTCNSSLIEIFD